MSDLVGLINVLIPFFGLIGIGIFVTRRMGLPEPAFAAMQAFLIYLALPCLFFRLISDKPLAELTNWRFVAGTTSATALAFTAAFLTGRRHGLGTPGATMAAVAGAYSNVGYMGPPLVLSVLGEAASAPVALIFVFDTVFLFTAVPALMAQSGGAAGRSPLALALDTLWRILTHPFVIGSLIGLAASATKVPVPAAVTTLVTWLSGASTPCALFLLGATVSLRPVGRIAPDVPPLVGIKLLGHPLAVWLILSALGGFDPVWTKAAVIMAALPPALNIFVLARQYDVGVERASACLLVGTVLSVLTLTGFVWLLETGWMPPMLLR